MVAPQLLLLLLRLDPHLLLLPLLLPQLLPLPSSSLPLQLPPLLPLLLPPQLLPPLLPPQLLLPLLPPQLLPLLPPQPPLLPNDGCLAPFIFSVFLGAPKLSSG